MSTAQRASDVGTTFAPGPELLATIAALYDRGAVVDALHLAEASAPLASWRGVDACVLAARIATNVGAPRLATRLAVRAARDAPAHPRARLQLGYDILIRRGPFALWRKLRAWQEGSADAPDDTAELIALKARAAISLRDFELAETLLARVETLAPRNAYLRLQRAHLLEARDRLDEALAVAAEARDLHPHAYHRPSVQTQAYLLQLLDRDDEAIELLEAACAELQSAPVAAQLYSLLSENGRWPAARETLERYAELSPLREPRLAQWLEAQRARAAYHSGQRAAAARHAAAVDDDFHRGFASRLAQPPPPDERIVLDVTFVRQHFKTCAPATLASLGRFFGLPAEHLELAEAVCYDGTPIWQQRRWAEANGWHVREFRVTHAAAVALLERRIPFAISTVEATSAHMMAVIGFDRTRGTLLFRDPSQPYVVESPADEFLERYKAFGPEGVVFVPADERARLDGVELPDAELYDRCHALSWRLAEHDRDGAAAALAALEEVAPDSACTWDARLELASYDGNVAEQLRCVDRLLDLFPDHPARLLRRFACMRDAPRDERIAFLTAACATRDADPALFVAMARALQSDARELPNARRYVRRALRKRPVDSDAIHTLGDLLWEGGAQEEATECYWFAASLEGYREHVYQAWFDACRRTRRTAEALVHLERRFELHGERSSQPALTLAFALRETDQPARAREVLDRAIARRPDDGHLLLRAAAMTAWLGDHERAARLLDEASTKVRRNDWLRARLEISELRLDFADVLAAADELLAAEPVALDAHLAAARARKRREGTPAALAALRAACGRNPQHYGLQRILVEWSREAGAEETAAAARALLAIEPADAWARRELALALLRLQRDDEALEEASEAARIEPAATSSYSTLAAIHRQRGEVDQARAYLRRAIELYVDNGDAIRMLLDLARTDAERRAELELVERELIRQVVMGDGLIAFVDVAAPMLDGQALLGSLRAAHTARPDLWHAWSALIVQLRRMHEHDEALALAQAACERFAHVPHAWLDRSLVHRSRGEASAELEAAERAFEMNPLWNPATLTLGGVLERAGRLDDAQRVYERALRLSPHDAGLHVARADVLWRQGLAADALAAIEQALRLSPTADRAWELLREWSLHRGEPERTVAFARSLAAERSGEARVWLILARCLGPDARLERAQALERALERNPRWTEAWDVKAELLTFDERFDDAVRACDDGTAVCTDEVHILGGRRAWVLRRRGHRRDAIEAMRAVLAEHEGYVWGWNELATWLLEENDLDGAAAAFDQLRRLRPLDSWVHRHIAFLDLQRGDRASAKRAFAAALEAEPTDVAAAHQLFELQLTDSELVAAAETLATMETHQPGAATLAARVALCIRQNRVGEARAALEALAVSQDPNPWPLNAAADAFLRDDRARTAWRVLRRAAKRADANPQAAAAAVHLLLAHSKVLAAVRVYMRVAEPEARRRASLPLLETLGRERYRLTLRWLLYRRGDFLRRYDDTWGQVGFALSNVKRMRAVAAWMSDWREREQIQPWMLFNYCLALRNTGRYAEATDVANHVVTTWEHRDGAADLFAFLAIEHALAGDVANARAALERSPPPRQGVPYDEQIAALTRALIEFHEAPPEERRRRFMALRPKLEAQMGFRDVLFASRDLRGTLQRAGRTFAAGGAGIRARFWTAWRLNWQWTLLGVLPLAVPVAMQSPILLGVAFWVIVAVLRPRS